MDLDHLDYNLDDSKDPIKWSTDCSNLYGIESIIISNNFYSFGCPSTLEEVTTGTKQVEIGYFYRNDLNEYVLKYASYSTHSLLLVTNEQHH